MDILERFFVKAGLSLSMHKSKIFVSKTTNRQLRSVISHVSGFHIISDLGKYLGLPLIHGRISHSTFSFLLDNLTNNMAAWKSNTLSMAGRVVLAKSSLSAIPTYTAQAIPLPGSICESIDKITRNFVWGHAPESSKPHLIKWDTLCKPKNNGGLALRSAKFNNLTFFMNAVWRLWKQEQSLWAQIFKHKYFPSSTIWEASAKKSHSQVWKFLMIAKNHMVDKLKWIIGNENSISFWYDNWCCGHVLRHLVIGPLSGQCEAWTVGDCLNPDMSCNEALFETALQPAILAMVLSVPLSYLSMRSDIPYWQGSVGDCTSAQAYKSLTLVDDSQQAVSS